MVENNPLLSVIIPVYGTEDFLPRCLDSVLNSTYQNIEIIVVDDKSPGNIDEIIDDYVNKKHKIKIVHHDENKGLFCARITGVENSHGQYIAFLDSDDHVSVDLYRRLIQKGEETDSDMVLGELFYEKGDSNIYIFDNLWHTRLMDIDLYGDAVSDILFEQEGKDFSLHVVWNKIYRRDLWEACYPYLKLQTQHLIMCEDVLFSSLFFYFSKHLTNIHNDFVYYFFRDESATGSNVTESKIKKNIRDILLVFETLDRIFTTQILDTQYLTYLKEWKNLLLRIWGRHINRSSLYDFEKEKLYDLFCLEAETNNKDIEFQDNFFYSVATDTDIIKSEEIKKRIVSDNIKVVSFDIFDTLISRPFWEPTDLFSLLNPFVNTLVKATDYFDFKQIRIVGEQRAREKNKTQNPMWEEITLDDIYIVIQELVGFPDDIIDKIKNQEIALEKKYCSERKYAKELFELALYCGKKVIIISDMYLPESVIEELLYLNGYEGYENLYVSSKIKFTKYSGNIYKFMLNDMQVDAHEVLHIGDNLYSDVKKAEELGLYAYHFPKASELLANRVEGVYSGESVQKLYLNSHNERGANQFLRFGGLKAMLGVVANKIFDNPYIIMNKGSDFNADPRYIGYYVLGMHLFSLTQWLIRESSEHQYSTINFMARDGYIPMEAFKIINKVKALNIDVNYTYFSRSAILPLQLQEKYDIFNLLQNGAMLGLSPKQFLEMLKDVIVSDKYLNCEHICSRNKIAFSQPFSTIESFFKFSKLFAEEFYDTNRTEDYRKKMKILLQPLFSGKVATFDMGYSCRIESTLKKNFGFNITPYYMHINNELPLNRSQSNDISIHTFYAYSPGVTGLLRELLISKMEPSCQALDCSGEIIKPIFKEYYLDYIEKYVFSLIQESALTFVKDMVEIFGTDIDYLTYQREDASIPYEYFHSQSKGVDRMVFSTILFENNLAKGKKTVKVLDLWNELSAAVTNNNVNADAAKDINYSISTIHRVKRIYWLFWTDRNQLKTKVKQRLKDSPKALGLLKGTYCFFRSIYRKVKL